jgi:PKHD-type hydroxylase
MDDVPAPLYFSAAIRKPAMTVQQLSPNLLHDGCDLQFHAATQIDTAPRTRGALIAFPSYVLHRVMPITRGVRKSVAVWITGLQLR